MKKEITIRNGAIQYGALGQLDSKDVILHIDEISIRADAALVYLKHGMNLADRGRCGECDYCKENKT